MPLNEAPATPEERKRAVRHWVEVVRPEVAAKEEAKPKETPEEALERLKAAATQPVVIGGELRKKLAEIAATNPKKGAAA